MVVYVKTIDSDDVLAYLTKTANIIHLANVKNWLQISFEPLLDKDKKRPRGRKPKIDKQAIIDLRQKGKSLSYIANISNCSRSYVQKIIKKNRKREQEDGENKVL